MSLKVKLSEKDHIQGPDNASIILVEYGDYQCPYCRDAYYIVKKVQKELGNHLKFAFRNFPLTELHPDALHAAIAAEIAASQGKFWEMHDILYENQEDLTDFDLLRFAGIIHLDTQKFEEEFGKDIYINKIKEDMESGMESGVQGTPTFFINGKIFTADWSGPEFIRYIKSLVHT